MKSFRKNIVWIASYPKSGNTWFRIFLSNLILGSPTPILINEIQNDYTSIASSRRIFDYYSGVNSSDLSYEQIENIRPEIYKAITNESEELIYLKTHDAWTLNGDNKPLFPSEVTKAVIYIIRHPIDVAKSFANHNSITIEESIKCLNNNSYSLSKNPKKLQAQLPQKLLSWSNHALSWINSSKLPVLVVKYEDMVNNSFSTFQSAVSFLGLKYQDSEIQTAVSNCSFHELQQQEKKNGFQEKPLKSTMFFRQGHPTPNIGELINTKPYNSLIIPNKEILRRFDYY